MKIKTKPHPTSYLGIVPEDPPPPVKIQWHETLEGIKRHPNLWFKMRTYGSRADAIGAASALRIRTKGQPFEIIARRSSVYGRYLQG